MKPAHLKEDAMRIRMAFIGLMIAATAMTTAPAHAEMNLLHSCTGKAALGAGAGAVLGGLLASKGQKTEGAALGAAVGGLGTFGVCRYIDTRAQTRIDKAYRAAAASNAPYSTSWSTKNGIQSVSVKRPVRDGENCKMMNATLSTPNVGSQQLPEETYCRNAKGQWRSAA
jgi:hypothetical protein